MTESVIYQKFIKIVKYHIVSHSMAFQNISFKYFSEDVLNQNIYTKEEIDDMKKSPLYMPYESVQNYFKMITKNNYNFCELTVIISSLYDSLLVYSDVIDILYPAVKNYYGKGKIQLNRDDIEDFITKVMETTSKYDPNIIRKQFKTIKLLELVIKSILKVIDNDIVPILPEKYRTLFELKKNVTFNTLKELTTDHLDYVDQDIGLLNKMFKKQNNELYTFIISSIDAFEEFSTFHTIFMLIYICKFDGINPNNVKSYLKKTYATDIKKLLKFTNSNFPVDKICMEILKNTLSKNILYTISLQYHKNLSLYKYITSK